MRQILCAVVLVASLFLGQVHATDIDNNAEPASIVSRIRRASVRSSAISAIGYSKHLRALEIEFVNGAIYRYLEVPAAVYRDLLLAGSKARFYDENIRHKYHSVHVRPRVP